MGRGSASYAWTAAPPTGAGVAGFPTAGEGRGGFEGSLQHRSIVGWERREQGVPKAPEQENGGGREDYRGGVKDFYLIHLLNKFIFLSYFFLYNYFFQLFINFFDVCFTFWIDMINLLHVACHSIWFRWNDM